MRYTIQLVTSLALALSAGLPTIAGAAEPEEPSTISVDELRAKYELPNSRYATLDGVELHYVDEGTGPPVILAHASYQGLRSWDGLAGRLKENYRVVRFDFPSAGLSVDNKPVPEEKFSMMGRYVDTIDNLTRHLGLDRFMLVGTSSGAAASFRFASANPDRVERLVLINSAGMPRIPRTDPLRDRPSSAKWANMDVRPREFWVFGMSQNFFKPGMPPDWIIDQAYDYARREGRAEMAKNYLYSTGDPKTILSKITAPTLIMWGKRNPTVMHLEADVIQHWMTGAPTAIRKYEGLGHYPYVEDLDAVYPDIAAFLAGEMDGELRKTTMLPVETD